MDWPSSWALPEILRPFAVALVGLLVPGIAWAHSSTPGMEGFYVGLLHPLKTPAQVLAFIALGLALGQGWPDSFKRSLPAFVLSLGAGIAVALGLGVVFAPDLPLIAAAFAAAVLAAATRPVPRLPTILLSAGTGALVGFASVPDPGPWRATAITLAGSVVGANLALFYVSGGVGWVRQRLDRPWAHIGWRVVSSWVAAIACLMLALGIAS